MVQHDDLSRSAQKLADDLLAGRKRHKTYRQLKMYNDPTLNPYLYGADAQASASETTSRLPTASASRLSVSSVGLGRWPVSSLERAERSMPVRSVTSARLSPCASRAVFNSSSSSWSNSPAACRSW